MSDVTFRPQSWSDGGKRVHAAGQDLSGDAQSFIAEVSDAGVFGGNDMIGGTAAMIYGLMIERLGGCLDTLADGYSGHGDLLTQAGKLYEQAEQDNTDQASHATGV